MKFPSKEFLQVIGTRLGFGVLRLEPDAGIGVVCPDEELDGDEAGLESAEQRAALDPNWLTARSVTGFEKLREEVVPEAAGSDVGSLLAQLSRSSSEYRETVADESAVGSTSGVLALGFPERQQPAVRAALQRRGGPEAVSFAEAGSRLPSGFQGCVVAYLLSTKHAARHRDALEALVTAGTPLIVVASRVAMAALGFAWPPAPSSEAKIDFLPTPWTEEELASRLTTFLGRAPEVHKPVVTARPERAPAQPEAPAGVRRILVVDTDPVARSLVESCLSSPGAVDCLAVGDGDAALRAIEEAAPDVVVMEITLPNRDGFQLLADLKRSARLRSTKVVVLTTRQAEVDVLRAFGLGADDYVTKPFSPLELRARVKRLLTEAGR